MTRIKWVFCLILLCISNIAFAKQRVAVLEFRGVGMESTILFQLSDEARGGVREGLPIREFDITSRENLKQMLEDMGKDMSACDVECEVTLGRVVGADYVLSGSIYQVEGTYILTMKLHDTMSASLLAQKRVEDQSQVGLLRKTNQVARAMITESIIEAQEQTTSRETVKVSFRSSNDGPDVTVLVGGRLICTGTPCSESVPSGKHEVQILKKDHFPWKETIELSSGKNVYGELKSTYATITVETNPKNLAKNLTLNGTQTPIVSKRVSAGDHTIQLQHPCYVTEGLKITSKPGSTENYSIEPKAIESAVNVLTYTTNNHATRGSVYIDGKYLGVTPLRTKVPLCSKELKVVVGQQEKVVPLSLRAREVSEFSLIVE